MVEKVTGSIFTRYEKSARSQQGMAIWRDEAFLYYHGGSCDGKGIFAYDQSDNKTQ